MDADPSPPPEQKPLRITLWCSVCGLSHTYTSEQMDEYVKSGWPKCCGQTMNFFPADPPETTNPAG